MSPEEISTVIHRVIERDMYSADAWAGWIDYRERLGLTFAFQTGQECIDEFLHWYWGKWFMADRDPNADICDRCELPWRSCCCNLDDDRAYNT